VLERTAEEIIADVERLIETLPEGPKPEHVFVPVEFFDHPQIRDILIEARREQLAHIHPQAGALITNTTRPASPHMEQDVRRYLYWMGL